ncbi:MAG: hypothetical protein ABJE99_06110 [Roseobacter sp.]
MNDFCAHKHPVLAVSCPVCKSRAGARCIWPSGQASNGYHLSRRAEADRVFIEHYGPDASIERIDGTWTIDPRGRAGIRPQPDKHALF